MLLAVNVGNGKISFATFAECSSEPVAKFKIAADTCKTADEYAVTVSQLLAFSKIDVNNIDGVIMAGVVPQLNDVIKHVVLTLTGKTPITVGPGVKTGFAIKIDDPAELGADIVANAAAVIAILKKEKLDRPAIILDMGTVTTLFAINKNREVVGGAILPGVDMSFDALHRETAQLPNVEMSGVTRAIGRNTKESLISGVILGQAAMIDGLVDRFEKELKCEREEAVLFATGEKYKSCLASSYHSFRYEQTLTLKGLACIYKNTVG
jgi:type III pantothenate kinase